MIKSVNRILFQQIKEYLSKEKNIELQDIEINGNSSNYLQAKDYNNCYMIKIISLIDQNDCLSDSLLQDAKQEAKAYKRCQHLNILKYYMDFQFNDHYFIVLERYETTLYDWIIQNKQQSLQLSQYIKFSLEMLTALLFLHKNMYVLRGFSLKSIKLDKELTIKLTDFGIPKKVELETLKSDLNLDDSILCLAPEMIRLDQQVKQKFLQNIRSDVWSIGICLYMLAGGEPRQIIQMIKGIDNFQVQQGVHEDINFLLLNILQRDRIQRPSLPYLIQSFINLRQSICELKEKLDDLVIDQKYEISNYLSIYQEGLKQYNLKNYDESHKLLKQVLKINPRCDVAYHKIGNIQQNKNIEVAKQFFRDAYLINKQYDVVLYNLGNFYKRNNMIKKSIKYYKKAIKINNLYEQYHYNLGNSYDDDSLKYRAIISFKQSFKLDPQKSQASFNLSVVYCKLQKYDKAIKQSKKTLSIDSQDETHVQIQETIKQSI